MNADDYGLTAGVNRAIEASHAAGFVTSTTVLVNGEAAGEVSDLPGRCESMSIGLHVNLTLGKPIVEPGRIPTLVDPNGIFHTRATLVKRLLQRKVSRDDVHREVTAQIEALARLGITASHWDTHLHVAEMPQLARAVGSAAREAGIPRARTPRLRVIGEAGSAFATRWRWRVTAPRTLAGEAARALSHRILARDFLLPDFRVAANAVVAPARTYAERWQIALSHLPPGTCEIVIHPGHLDARLRELTPNLTSEREIDLAVATSPRTRALLDTAGVRLIPFTQLG